jgi:hypothetical protein
MRFAIVSSSLPVGWYEDYESISFTCAQEKKKALLSILIVGKKKAPEANQRCEGG